MTDVTFNPNSFDATMSRVIQHLEQGDEAFNNLRDAIRDLGESTKKLTNTISCLPCSAHEERLKAVEAEVSHRRSFWSEFRLVIIGCVLTAVLSIGATLFIVH